MKKTKYIIPILALLLSTTMTSQHKRVKVSKDKIRAYKIAHITERLNLTEKEAQQFWPIYNSYEATLDRLRKEESSSIRKLIANGNDIDNVSEPDAKQIMTLIQSIKDKVHSRQQEYFKKLKKVLSYKKILKLQVSEREFKRILFEKMRKRRKLKREKD